MKVCLAGSRSVVILICVIHTVFRQAASHVMHRPAVRERRQEFFDQRDLEIYRHRRSADEHSNFTTTSSVATTRASVVLTFGVISDHPRTDFMVNSSTAQMWTSDENETESNLIFVPTTSITHLDPLHPGTAKDSNLTTTSDVAIHNDTTFGDISTVVMATNTTGNEDESWPLKTWETLGLIVGIVIGAMVILSLLIYIVPRRKSKKNAEVQMDDVAADQSFEDKRISQLINPIFDISSVEVSKAASAHGYYPSVSTIDSGLPASVASPGDGNDNLGFSNEVTDYYKLQEARMQNDGASECFYERVDLFKQPPTMPRQNSNSVYNSPIVQREWYVAPIKQAGTNVTVKPNANQENAYSTPVPQIIQTGTVYNNNGIPSASRPTALGARRIQGVNKLNVNVSQCPPSPRLVGRLRGDYSHLLPFPPSPELPSFIPHKRPQGATNPTTNKPATAFPRDVREQPPFVADRTMTLTPAPAYFETSGNFLLAPKSGNLAVDTPRTVKKAYDELRNVLDDIPNELFED